MINWDFITRHNRDYDPQNFNLNKYCQVLEAMSIAFVHRPVEEVLAKLEKRAEDLVNQNAVAGEEKTTVECLQRCIDEQRYGIGIVGSAKGASEKKKAVEAHFIGRCYEFALDIMIADLGHDRKPTEWTEHKRLVLTLWNNLNKEMTTFLNVARKTGGPRAMMVSSFKKRLEELLATFKIA